MIILDEITSGRGFCLEQLAEQELECLRSLINDQYLDRLAQLQPDLVPVARELGITQYHTLPISFDHGRSWPKAARLLDTKHIPAVANMGFFRRIREQFGDDAFISNDELNWRLVRPGQASDVGPVHVDKWFWDAGYGEGSMPNGFDRFKVWIAIHTESGSNGLSVKPDSQRFQWKHHFEERDGALKPVIDEDPAALEMALLPLDPGRMVLFHDELLHGGVVNGGTKCRVSIELTVLFGKAEAQHRANQLRRELAVA